MKIQKSLLFAIICLLLGSVAKTFAGDSFTFPSFNTGTITGGGAAVTKVLTVSGLPTNEYFFVSVTADFVPGAAPHGAYSSSMRMEINNGGSTVYWPLSTATNGVLPAAGSTTLTWRGVLSRTYLGGGNLSVKFQDPFTDASGPYTASLNNVVVTLYPAPAPKKTFAAFNTGTITGGGAGFTQALNVSSMPTSEYLLVTVTGDFVPGAPKSGYSSSMKMELNNGSSTVYWPLSLATTGVLPGAGSTSLTWTGILPKSYIGGGNLSIKFQDTYTDASGPYTETMNNVVVTIYPAPPPTKTFVIPSTGTITGGGPAVTQVLNVTDVPNAEYLLFSVTGNFVPGASPHGGWSSTMKMEINNGSSTVYWPLSTATTGILPGEGSTTLTWRGILPKSYIGGGNLALKFQDPYTDAGHPYISTLNNVTATIYPVYTAPPVITSPLTLTGVYNTLISTYTITASGSPTNFGAYNLPFGLSINTTSGQITGTPTQSGTNSATITATNLGGVAFATLAISIAPAITNITGPANGSYKLGGNLDFTVKYNAPVIMSSFSGVPSIPLVVGSTARNASYLSGSGTTTLIFRYTVQSGDNDANGIDSASPISLIGSTIQDSSGINAALTFIPPTTTGVLVDTTAPTITSALTANGTYGSAFTYNIASSESPVTFGATALPAGLSVNTSSGQITGTPTTSGIFNAVLSATDTAGNIGKITNTLTIAKVALSAIADSKSRSFGVANPTFTGSITGVIGSDNITASYNTVATPSSAPGTYSIVPSLNDPNGRLPNYNVTLVNGTLTIAPKPPLVITSTTVRNGNLIFSGTNGYGTAVGNFYVRSSTNVAAPFAIWAYDTTNQFGATGTFSVTNTINPGTPSMFYRLDQP